MRIGILFQLLRCSEKGGGGGGVDKNPLFSQKLQYRRQIFENKILKQTQTATLSLCLAVSINRRNMYTNFLMGLPTISAFQEGKKPHFCQKLLFVLP